MTFSPRAWWEWLWTPTGKTAVRYSITSVISTGVTLVVLSITYGVLRLWSPVVCSVVANMVAAIPSYYLNRNWAWEKTSRSHLLKEVLPFWSLTVLGIVLSLASVALADRYSYLVTSSHFGKSILVDMANVAAFGVIWVGKFLAYNRYLFGMRTRPVESEEDATDVVAGGEVAVGVLDQSAAAERADRADRAERPGIPASAQPELALQPVPVVSNEFLETATG